MIYGLLLQGAEMSISVRAFRKHILPGRLCEDGAAAISERFDTPRYDVKSRLHWDLYYAEFENATHKGLTKHIWPAILRVNSQIHKEAEPILYKSHTFDFGVCPTAALAFYQAIPLAAIPFIPRIRIDFSHTMSHDYFHPNKIITNETDFSKTCNALAKLNPGLKLSTALTLDYKDEDLDSASWSFVRALARLQGIKGLRSAKGKAFASDFTNLIRGTKWVQDSNGHAIKKIEYA
ncbi:MAG: hypothetical protein Q9192_007099, partial [Flavoplaca navasiana]